MNKKANNQTSQSPCSTRGRKDTVLVGAGFARPQKIASALNKASLVPQALFCRLLQLTDYKSRGKADSSVGFSPFPKGTVLYKRKGLKPTAEGLWPGSINPSAEADGKREPATWGIAPYGPEGFNNECIY